MNPTQRHESSLHSAVSSPEPNVCHLFYSPVCRLAKLSSHLAGILTYIIPYCSMAHELSTGRRFVALWADWNRS